MFPPSVAAALLVLASTFGFALVFASGKLAGGDIPSVQIVLIRYVSGFLVASAAAGFSSLGLRRLLTTERRWLHLMRAACGAGGGGATIYAATHMPLADTSSLGLTQGVFIVLLALMFLHERVTKVQWLATALCLAGAFVLIRGQAPEAGTLPDLELSLAPLLALLGALLIAGEIVLIKLLVEREHALTMLLYVNGLAALLLAVPAALLWQPIDLATLAALMLLGPLAIGGQYLNVLAYRRADAAFLAPFGYSAVVFSAVIGWMLFDEVPGTASFLGAALIVAGGVLLVRSGPR